MSSERKPDEKKQQPQIPPPPLTPQQAQATTPQGQQRQGEQVNPIVPPPRWFSNLPSSLNTSSYPCSHPRNKGRLYHPRSLCHTHHPRITSLGRLNPSHPCSTPHTQRPCPPWPSNPLFSHHPWLGLRSSYQLAVMFIGPSGTL